MTMLNQIIVSLIYSASDATLKGKIFSWDLKSYSQLNSLDLDRFEQAYRSKITLSKTIDLITYRYLQKKKIKENKRIGQI